MAVQKLQLQKAKQSLLPHRSPLLQFFFSFLLCAPKQLPDLKKKKQNKCRIFYLYILSLCYVMLCFSGISLAFISLLKNHVSPSNSIPQLHPVEGRNQVNHEDIICSLPQFTQKELRCCWQFGVFSWIFTSAYEQCPQLLLQSSRIRRLQRFWWLMLVWL